MCNKSSTIYFPRCNRHWNYLHSDNFNRKLNDCVVLLYTLQYTKLFSKVATPLKVLFYDLTLVCSHTVPSIYINLCYMCVVTFLYIYACRKKTSSENIPFRLHAEFILSQCLLFLYGLMLCSHLMWEWYVSMVFLAIQDIVTKSYEVCI